MKQSDLRKRLMAILAPAVRPDETAVRDARSAYEPSPEPVVYGKGKLPISMLDSVAAMVAAKEGFRGTAYQDKIGTGKPWTIGYGSRGKWVKPGTTITEPAARDSMRAHVLSDSDELDRRNVPQSVGLLSAMYNTGGPHLNKGGVLSAIRDENYELAATELEKITSSGGKVRQGLKTRREQEADLIRGLGGPLSSLFMKTRKP